MKKILLVDDEKGIVDMEKTIYLTMFFCKNVDRVQITNQDCVHFAVLLGV